MLQSDLGWLRNLRTGSCPAKLLRKLKIGSRPGSLLRKLKNESGSAVVEFVALALPLFVPVIIFLSHFATLSNDEFMVRTLARESVRAYILSANDLSATLNARNTMKTGARELGLKEDRIKDLSFTVDCAGLFCITPDNKVEITITLRSQDGKRVSTATARETVSPWV
jgi:Flp pilus assembly protein TadG